MIRPDTRRIKVKHRIIKAVRREHAEFGEPPRKVDICQFGRKKADAQFWLKACDELVNEGALATKLDAEGSVLLYIPRKNHAR